MKQLTTKQEILNYLEQHQTATVFEISRALNTSKQNIQYHLKILNQERRVRVSGTEQSSITGIGRKALVYSSDTEVTGQNYQVLIDCLLSLVPKGRQNSDEFFVVLAQRMFPIQMTRNNPTTKLNEAVKVLNSHGYRSRWEAHLAGPKVTFTQCPYSSLIDKHPELCSLDCTILNQLTQIIFILDKRFKTNDPTSNCIFKVKSSD